jgi:protein disulfide-isomerase
MRLLLTSLLTCFILTANAQDASLVWHTDMMKAVDISIKEKKPLMLFFTGSDWCGWCKKLQAEVFYQPDFAKWAKANVVLVELDFPRRTALSSELQQQNGELQRMFEVRGYPTIWLVTPTKQDANVNFGKLGSTGYLAGGAKAWTAAADQIINQAK